MATSSVRPDEPGPRPPKRESSRPRYQQRRNEVVDKAARIIAEKGFHATSVQNLVDATGLQRGGLYHYIGAKVDILVAIHERFIEPLLAEAREIAALEEDPSEKLRRLAHALIDNVARYPDQVTVFLRDWRVIADHPSWADLHAQRQELERIVMRVLDEGRSQGDFEFEDLRLALLCFLGMINYTYHWYKPGEFHSADRIADTFTDIFLGGIELAASRSRRRGPAKARTRAKPKAKAKAKA